MKSTYSLIKKVLKSNKGGKALFLINHVCFTYAIFQRNWVSHYDLFSSGFLWKYFYVTLKASPRHGLIILIFFIRISTINKEEKWKKWLYFRETMLKIGFTYIIK